ncbi:MAG: hypothetical protein JSU01_22235 [Bacteroidetes bacterium]|nr:hypothetical protein [Bacteroidota bacterium]
MKKFLTLTLICTGSIAFCQSKIDSALFKKISMMFNNDQKWRLEYMKISNGQKSAYSQATIDSNWNIADSLNLIEAKSIIHQYGFPGYSLVGKEGSNRFWAIVQHCDEEPDFQ